MAEGMWGEVRLLLSTLWFLAKLEAVCLINLPMALVVLMFPRAKGLRRKYNRVSHKGVRWLVHHMNGAKMTLRGELRETDEPCILLVASHASILDAPIMLSLRPMTVVMTKEYVGHNIFYGTVAKAMGMFSIGEGYEQMVSVVDEKIKDGYSVVVFAEGRRTYDGELQRFHKGAFYIAERLGVTIQPVFIYGTYNVINRNRFRLHSNPYYVEVMEPIKAGNERYGKDYRVRAKMVEGMFREKVREYSDRL